MVRIEGEESDSSCEILETPPSALVNSTVTRKRRRTRRCASALAGRFVDRSFVVWFFEEDPIRARRAGEVYDSLSQRGATSREWIREFADLMSSDSSDDDSCCSRYPMGRREFAPRAESYIMLPTDLASEEMKWVDREVLGVVSHYATKGGNSCRGIPLMADDDVSSSSEDGSDEVGHEEAGEEEADVEPTGRDNAESDSTSSWEEEANVARGGQVAEENNPAEAVPGEEEEEEEEDRPYWAVAPGLDERVCHNTGVKDRNSSFFMYEVYFRILKVRLPFTEFEMDLLGYLSVAPSQLHPNTWGFIKAFQVFCRVRSMPCTVNLFFWLFSVRGSTNTDEDKAGRRGWISLQARSKCSLFKPFSTSFKGWKPKYFKVFFQPDEARRMTGDDGQFLFPLYWNNRQMNLKRYKTDKKSLTPAELTAAAELRV